MLTKYILHIGKEEYELQEDDLRNWDEIKVSYKRGDYDGVVRSFSSQFEFVNRAKELLLEVYLKDRYKAQVLLSVYVMNNNWVFEKRFECPLDFSTIEWEEYVLKINSVDNDLAALIKANKSTKYEFIVGTDIVRDNVFNFDRIPMQESISYEFTQGTTYDDCADIMVRFERDQLPWIGNVGSEISINGVVDWRDDQETEATSYLFQVIKDVNITLEFDLEWRTDQGSQGTSLYVRISRNGKLVELTGTPQGGNGGNLCTALRDSTYNRGTFSNPGDLPDPSSLDPKEGSYAIIGGTVWILQYNGQRYSWVSTGKSATDYFVRGYKGRVPLNLKAGDKVLITHELYTTGISYAAIRFTRSLFTFNWMGRGEIAGISVFKPKKIATELLRKIAGNKVNVDVYISNQDPRLNNTFIFAAESARGLANAKFYSSFNEFCDWMSAVFGYVYYIGAPQPPKYKYIQVCGEIEHSAWAYKNEYYKDGYDENQIIYISGHGRFFYHEPNTTNIYTKWPGWEYYNNPETGYARTDTLFYILELSPSNLYYFEEYSGTTLYPNLYDFSEEYIGNDGQTVYFVHRSEILRPDAEIRSIENCTDVKYSVEDSMIYASVTAGYEKKDYDSINGRDEFNFNNTYSTGCTVTDKALSLLSKYRADCYGIEFAVQKRGEDTTDSSADQDVFFVLCKNQNGTLTPDRSLEIKNSISGEVFNGAFSPMACVRANAGLVCLQADALTLEFASSTGNSDIVIDGVAMNSNLYLNEPLATCGTVEFTTDYVDEIANVDELIEIQDDGMIYLGFLKEVDIKYAKTEAATYKLIVKEIRL